MNNTPHRFLHLEFFQMNSFSDMLEICGKLPEPIISDARKHSQKYSNTKYVIEKMASNLIWREMFYEILGHEFIFKTTSGRTLQRELNRALNEMGIYTAKDLIVTDPKHITRDEIYESIVTTGDIFVHNHSHLDIHIRDFVYDMVFLKNVFNGIGPYISNMSYTSSLCEDNSTESLCEKYENIFLLDKVYQLPRIPQTV